jgi:NADH-quinone oxidoreductase subunit J
MLLAFLLQNSGNFFFNLASSQEENLIFSFFLFFSFFSLVFTYLVAFSENLIYSLFSLVLTFLCSSCILILCNVEFLALAYVVVYAGGVAVIFAIALMVLNLKKEVGLKLNFNAFSYLIFFILLLCFFFYNLSDYMQINQVYEINKDNRVVDVSYVYSYLIDDISIFRSLYIEYSGFLIIIALILLAIMIGCLMLCLGVRRSFKG